MSNSSTSRKQSNFGIHQEIEKDLVVDEIDNLRNKLNKNKLCSECEKNPTNDEQFDTIFDIYKTIYDTRKFEIENYWRRALFFWGMITIVLVAYYRVGDGLEVYRIYLAEIGFFFSLAFSLSLRGSKYWQEHWEKITTTYEEALDFTVYNWKTLDKITTKNENTTMFKPYKFSVSKLTMILGDITVLMFVFLSIKEFIGLKPLDDICILCIGNPKLNVIASILFFIFGSTIVLNFLSKTYYGHYKKKNDKDEILSFKRVLFNAIGNLIRKDILLPWGIDWEKKLWRTILIVALIISIILLVIFTYFKYIS